MKETIHPPLVAGGLWVCSGQVIFDVEDLADTVGDPDGDRLLCHRVTFPKDSRPSTSPHIGYSQCADGVRGVPRQQLDIANVGQDGFDVLLGRKTGTAFLYFGVSWIAIGANGAGHD